jgi:hypothetical protein
VHANESRVCGGLHQGGYGGWACLSNAYGLSYAVRSRHVLQRFLFTFAIGMNVKINRLVCWAPFVVALGISACAPTKKPESVMSSVHPGMTRDDVVSRIGPPDHLYGATGKDCFEYLLGDDGHVPFAVYFSGNIAVTAVHANCKRAF